MNKSIPKNGLPMLQAILKKTFGKCRIFLPILAGLLLLPACKDIVDPVVDELVKPKGPKPEWGPTIDPQMLTVIEELKSYNTPPLPTLTADQARETPSPQQAYMQVLKKNGLTPPVPAVNITQKVIPGPAPEGILVRIYTPKQGNGPFPVVVYYHGGGWVIAGLNTYEPSAGSLAEKTGAIVVSVAYRQAPEHMFPAAHEDSYAAYKWVLDNAASINGDPDRVATAGESAGGNLAVAVAIMARERGTKLPVHILSVYPIADGDVQSPSYDKYASALPLNRPLMAWFFDKYVPDWRTTRHELISLIHANVSGLPPTTIINAEIDPLEHEGGQLADHMLAAGIDVVREVYPGVTHEFYGMTGLLEQAREAQDLSAGRLKSAFSMVK